VETLQGVGVVRLNWPDWNPRPVIQDHMLVRE
jgi:hypothetical protein